MADAADSWVAGADDWPKHPYKGLDYFTIGERALYAGRDEEISECTSFLTTQSKSLFILYGSTGCGKSSFIRAGLIPSVEGREFRHRFLSRFEPKSCEHTPNFIRCTNHPMKQLATAVHDFAKAPPVVRTITKRQTDLSEVYEQYETKEDFITCCSNPNELLERLKILERKVPGTLIIIIDQAEEVITLTEKSDPRRQQFFDFMARAVTELKAIKFLCALRSDYLGVFEDEIGQEEILASRRARFGLDKMTESQVRAAILRPTNKGDARHGHPPYNFAFEEGVVETLVHDLFEMGSRDSVLAALQIVCADLFRRGRHKHRNNSATAGEFFQITEKDYSSGKGTSGRIDKYISNAIRGAFSEAGIEREFPGEEELWRHALLQCLVQAHADGRATTSQVPIGDLLAELQTSALPPDQRKAAIELLMRRDGWFLLREVVSAEGANDAKVALAHDVIALGLSIWGKSYTARKEEREKAKTEWLAAKRRVRRSAIVANMIYSVILTILFVAGGTYYSEDWVQKKELRQTLIMTGAEGAAKVGHVQTALTALGRLDTESPGPLDWNFERLSAIYRHLFRPSEVDFERDFERRKKELRAWIHSALPKKSIRLKKDIYFMGADEAIRKKGENQIEITGIFYDEAQQNISHHFSGKSTVKIEGVYTLGSNYLFIMDDGAMVIVPDRGQGSSAITITRDHHAEFVRESLGLDGSSKGEWKVELQDYSAEYNQSHIRVEARYSLTAADDETIGQSIEIVSFLSHLLSDSAAVSPEKFFREKHAVNLIRVQPRSELAFATDGGFSEIYDDHVVQFFFSDERLSVFVVPNRRPNEGAFDSLNEQNIEDDERHDFQVWAAGEIAGKLITEYIFTDTERMSGHFYRTDGITAEGEVVILSEPIPRSYEAFSNVDKRPFQLRNLLRNCAGRESHGGDKPESSDDDKCITTRVYRNVGPSGPVVPLIGPVHQSRENGEDDIALVHPGAKNDDEMILPFATADESRARLTSLLNDARWFDVVAGPLDLVNSGRRDWFVLLEGANDFQLWRLSQSGTATHERSYLKPTHYGDVLDLYVEAETTELAVTFSDPQSDEERQGVYWGPRSQTEPTTKELCKRAHGFAHEYSKDSWQRFLSIEVVAPKDGACKESEVEEEQAND